MPQKPGVLLQPIPPATRIWEDLSMDFDHGLPISEGHLVNFVGVDRFSKGACFGSLPISYTAYKVAHLFVTLVAKLHSMSRSIISDYDPVFLNKYWQESSLRLVVLNLRMSTDGQTEVANRTLQQYL